MTKSGIAEVRRASIYEVPRLRELIFDAQVESPRYRNWGLSRTRLEDWLIGQIWSPQAVVLAIGEPAFGLIIGRVFPHEIFDRQIAAEKLFYLSPDQRSLTTAQALLQSFVDWATTQGAETIEVGTSSGYRPNLVKRLFESADFIHYGYLLEREVAR